MERIYYLQSTRGEAQPNQIIKFWEIDRDVLVSTYPLGGIHSTNRDSFRAELEVSERRGLRFDLEEAASEVSQLAGSIIGWGFVLGAQVFLMGYAAGAIATDRVAKIWRAFRPESY